MIQPVRSFLVRNAGLYNLFLSLPCVPHTDVLPHYKPKINGAKQLWTETPKSVSEIDLFPL
jgi:hypothetical protein